MCFDQLKALGREFETAQAAIEQFETAQIDDDARMIALCEARDAIAEKIIAATAFSPAGVATKARVAMVVCRPTGDAIEERALRSLIVAVSDAAL